MNGDVLLELGGGVGSNSGPGQGSESVCDEYTSWESGKVKRINDQCPTKVTCASSHFRHFNHSTVALLCLEILAD